MHLQVKFENYFQSSKMMKNTTIFLIQESLRITAIYLFIQIPNSYILTKKNCKLWTLHLKPDEYHYSIKPESYFVKSLNVWLFWIIKYSCVPVKKTAVLYKKYCRKITEILDKFANEYNSVNCNKKNQPKLNILNLNFKQVYFSLRQTHMIAMIWFVSNIINIININ